jgi:membrane protein DedA with SNARE-associated domain
MPDLAAILVWLTELRAGTLLAAMALLAALENVFPPIPADVLVAFGGFIAARAGRSPWPPFFAVWGGNVAGALLMFWLGRRYGTSWIERRFRWAGGPGGRARLLSLHARFGVAAFFISRFLPGVRSIVPPIAGALGIPATGAMLAVSLASALWYGFVTWFAFSAGGNWDALVASIGRLGTWSGVIATSIVAIIALVWWLRRRRRA